MFDRFFRARLSRDRMIVQAPLGERRLSACVTNVPKTETGLTAGLGPACGVTASRRPSHSIRCPQELEKERPIGVVLGRGSASFRPLHDRHSPRRAHAPVPSFASPGHNHVENGKLVLPCHRSAAAVVSHAVGPSIHF